MTDTMLSNIDRYIEEHIGATIAELAQLCSQPSISSQGQGIIECANLVDTLLAKRGLATEIVPTAGHPVVLAQATGNSPRTLLFYNHYDVQPPEPLELWESPPFELIRRDGKLVARGVSDDKGELISRLAALDAVRAVTGGLPCGIKFLVEGEEEVGSPNLAPFIEQHAERLSADACIWEFGSVNYAGAPVQYLGVRGICYVELKVQTATLDAHSGLGGSIFPNAAWRLAWALNTLKRPDEHIRIPGFYDDVVPPSDRDLELLAALPDESEHYRATYGIRNFVKDLSGAELRREEVFVPTCTICGLTAGYQGPGSKTVLPAQASAKIDFRLVPNQNPHDIATKLRAHLDAEGFSDIEVSVLGSLHPARTDPSHPFIKLVSRTAAEVYDQPMQVWPMIGGSGPNYYFAHHLKLPIASAGVSHPGSQIHAPNENIRIDDLLRAIKHVAHIILAMGADTLD